MLLARDDVPARLRKGSAARLQAVPRVDVGTREQPGEHEVGVETPWLWGRSALVAAGEAGSLHLRCCV